MTSHCDTPAAPIGIISRSDATIAMDAKAKPPGSLGLLEDWAIRLAMLQGTLRPQVNTPTLLLFAADHGITAARPEVTASVFNAIARGQAASCVLCASSGIALRLTDVGVDCTTLDCGQTRAASGIHTVSAKACPQGTASFLDGPAMTAGETNAAIAVGRGAVKEARAVGSTVVAVGELGIGNTTSAAALLAALTGTPAEAVCGRGTGVNSAGLQAKQAVIAAALEHHALSPSTPTLNVLAAVGGAEIAAMVGAFLEASDTRTAAVVDGFVSGVAALVAVRTQPAVAEVLFGSHCSAEKGTAVLLDALQLAAPLNASMRLGEGTGAVLAVGMLRGAAALFEMADLADIVE